MPVAKPKPIAKKPAVAKAKSAVAKDSYGPQPGTRAPDFSLPDETGRLRKLGDFRGKKLVVYFYPKDFTGGCTRESCDFRDNLNRMASSGAAVVGVSADPVESHAKFKKKESLNFPLLSDPERKMIKAYGVWRKKSLYGREFMGIVRTTFIVDEKGMIATVFPKVKVEGHVDAVLGALAPASRSQ